MCPGKRDNIVSQLALPYIFIHIGHCRLTFAELFGYFRVQCTVARQKLPQALGRVTSLGVRESVLAGLPTQTHNT